MRELILVVKEDGSFYYTQWERIWWVLIGPVILTSIELNEKIHVANLNQLNFIACCYCMNHICNKEYKKRLGDFRFPMVVQLSVHGPKLWANHPYIKIICQLSICKDCNHHKYVNWISLLWKWSTWLMNECFTILMSH